MFDESKNAGDGESGTREAGMVILLLGAVIYLSLVLKTAWVSDDAFFTFRTIDNFVSGHGLRWNVSERVQVYSHPLWMMLLSAVYSLSREPVYTSIIVSIVLSAAAFVVLGLSVLRSNGNVALVVGTLILSSSYVTYSTSGLENPLTHLLLVIFLSLYVGSRNTGSPALWGLAFLAGLLTLCRMDLVLIVAPMLCYKLLHCRKSERILAIVAGFAPFIYWTVFSLFYYGFPFPNTAYAKLGTGIPAMKLVEQGFFYVANCIERDPLTLVVIAVSALLPLVARNSLYGMISIGNMLYVLYIIKIGGCFMSGRFFTAPLVCSLFVLGGMRKLSDSTTIIVLVLISMIGLWNPYNPIGGRDGGMDSHGIADERAVYYPATGLFNSTRNEKLPRDYPFIRDGKKMREDARLMIRTGPYVFETTPKARTHGMAGFFSGPDVHIVDTYALADPLLARIPMRADNNWRIGHFIRIPPEGYVETLRTGSNVIRDEQLATYYDKLSIIVRGDLISGGRLIEIVKINLGMYDHLLERDGILPLDIVRRDIDELSTPKKAGATWNAIDNTILSRSGVLIGLKSIRHDKKMEVSLDHNDDYEIVYLLKGSKVGSYVIGRSSAGAGGLAIYDIPLPPPVVQKGFDALIVRPSSGDDNYSMGHVRLHD